MGRPRANQGPSQGFPLPFLPPIFFLLRGPPKPKNPKREAGGGEIGALAAVLAAILALLAAILALPAVILALLATLLAAILALLAAILDTIPEANPRSSL